MNPRSDARQRTQGAGKAGLPALLPEGAVDVLAYCLELRELAAVPAAGRTVITSPPTVRDSR